MVEKRPVFSICIPAHNPFPFLENALASVESQTLTDWEIIIVDDCSDDVVEERLRKSASYFDGKIKCVRLDENNGPFYARRVAFGLASGIYILCIDADDELLGPSVLDEIYSAASSVGVLPDVVFFNAITNKQRHDNWVDYCRLGFQSGPLPKDVVMRAFLATHMLNNLWLKAIRTECLLPVELEGTAGLYMCEDRLEIAGVLAKANDFLLIDEPLYFYRQNPNSTTHRLFELEYCRQQSYVEKLVANLFSDEYELDELYKLFLRVWADDMCRIAQGRTYGEAIYCFREMAADPFYNEARAAVGIFQQRWDYRLLLSLLARGNYAQAVAMANMSRVSRAVVKKLLSGS